MKSTKRLESEKIQNTFLHFKIRLFARKWIAVPTVETEKLGIFSFFSIIIIVFRKVIADYFSWFQLQSFICIFQCFLQFWTLIINYRVVDNIAENVFRGFLVLSPQSSIRNECAPRDVTFFRYLCLVELSLFLSFSRSLSPDAASIHKCVLAFVRQSSQTAGRRFSGLVRTTRTSRLHEWALEPDYTGLGTYVDHSPN